MKLEDSLSVMRDAWTGVLELTQTFCEGDESLQDADNAADVIAGREGLINTLISVSATVPALSPWEGSLALSLRSDIENLKQSVAQFEVEFEQIMKTRLNSIGAEIGGINRSAKVIKAYNR